MTNRRHFLQGIAATGAALACPAQPATDFFALDTAAPGADATAWFLAKGDGAALYSMPHPVTYPMAQAWTTEPIDHRAFVNLGRKYTKALFASMQEVRANGGGGILNNSFNRVAP